MTQENKTLKMLPHSVEAEQSLLAGVLMDERVFDDVISVVYEKHFYRKEHQAIYQQMYKLKINNKNIDVVSVTDALRHSEQLEQVGGIDYLYGLVEAGISVNNILSYAEIIRANFVLRELISVGNGIADSGYFSNGKSVDILLDEAEQKIFKIKDQNVNNKHFSNFAELLNQVITEAQLNATGNNNGVTGIATHFTELDKNTAGLQRGELIIIAGRPAMGKTSFALNIAENVAVREGLPVAIFSLEMPAHQLAQRILSSASGVDQSKMKRGGLTPDDFEKLTIGFENLATAPIYIAEATGINVMDLRARARRLAEQVEGKKLGLIVIDYVQIMSGFSTGSNTNRTQEIAEISRSLKTLALELDVPIILLSQLNRDVESRTDKRPNISDLRESGALEQDADIIMLLYRDEYYNKDESKYRGQAEVDIAKNRSGSTGVIHLAFLAQYTRFDNLSISYDNDQEYFN